MTGLGIAAIGIGIALIWAGIRDEAFSDLVSKTFGGAGTTVVTSAVGAPGLGGGGGAKREL